MGKPERTPAQRALISRIGGLAKSARYDGREATAAARAAFNARFETQVDPDGVLPPEERRRRAEAARKLHFTKLALRSANARRNRANRRA